MSLQFRVSTSSEFILYLTGMEWERVMVLDEAFKDLSKYVLLNQFPFSSSPSLKAASKLDNVDGCLSAQLDWISYGDHYNLWYVALTRAKRVMSVPPKFMQLLNDLRRMNELIRLQSIVPTKQKEIKSVIVIGEKEWSFEEIRLIHKDIFLPLKAELQSRGGLVIDNIKYF